MKKDLVGDQKNLDVAAPFGEITGDDFSKLRGKREMNLGGSGNMEKDPRYQQLMQLLNEATDPGDIESIKNDIRNEFGVKMMGGGSVDDKMKYGGGGDIMIKTVEISLKVPEKQKRGTGAAMTGTKFSGTF